MENLAEGRTDEAGAAMMKVCMLMAKTKTEVKQKVDEKWRARRKKRLTAK